jgi:DNA-binding beta-propeller fold protein YncE
MRLAQTLAGLLAAASTLGLAAAAQAQTVAGLVDGKSIVWIDSKAKKVTGSTEVKGATLAGIDVRPADGKLYAVTTAGDIVIVDLKTGGWTKKSTISEKLPEGVMWSVDFNPVADRLRVIGSDGTSLRINVDDGKTIVDGKLKYADADANKGKAPKAVAVAYSNSFAGTKETTLYDIDATAGTLVRQVPPNDGVLNTIGKVEVKFDGPVAFDIWSDGKGGNAAWIVAGGALHMVDLATAKVTTAGPIAGLKGKVSDIAVLPPS